jgi:hypothetical protein
MTIGEDLTAQGLYGLNHIGSVGTVTAGGIWDQITSNNKNVYTPTEVLLNRIEKLELQNKFLSLSILRLEDKFTQEEVNNIKSMLTSNDEASIILADTIIENAQL